MTDCNKSSILSNVFSQFDVGFSISEYGNGHINDTYLSESTPKMILQRINTNVFHNPDAVMENIVHVTQHLRKKIELSGGSPDRETLTVVQTLDKKNFYRADDGSCYRMYKYITDSKSYETATAELMYKAGKMFGKFQNLLKDFDASVLNETITDFHNTPKRTANLKKAVINNISGRADSVYAEIRTAEHLEKYADAITSKIRFGSVPVRVTHNDTKLNNILFDKTTNDGLCVIDLDTVMPGSILYDFGDALRFGASSAAEDEPNLDKVYFDLDKFRGFARGFLEQTSDILTKAEIELLPISAIVMTYECGVRFLEDHICGDKYFKTHRTNHNLDRCRTQFRLVEDMEQKLDDIKNIISECL